MRRRPRGETKGVWQAPGCGRTPPPIYGCLKLAFYRIRILNRNPNHNPNCNRPSPRPAAASRAPSHPSFDRVRHVRHAQKRTPEAIAASVVAPKIPRDACVTGASPIATELICAVLSGGRGFRENMGVCFPPPVSVFPPGLEMGRSFQPPQSRACPARPTILNGHGHRGVPPVRFGRG
jgi:hypothetical protein